MKTVLLVLLAIAALLLLLELSLRLLFGFGDPLIYVADDQIGYLLAPNQRVRRMGKRIAVNQYSMRSADIIPARSPSTLRVLLLGDSVANGGWWTDQDQTISALLQRQLQSLLTGTSLSQVQVLNASANSWGPRNELAYLKRFGTFDAQVLLLLLNTDDLFSTAPTSIPVGRSRNYPDRKPPAALVELLSRFLPSPKIPELAAIEAEGGDRVGINLAAIQQIHALMQQSSSQLILGMTPLLREIGTPGSRNYEITARQRLIDFTEHHQIPYIDFLTPFNSVAQPETLYIDHIHLNAEGNQQVTERLVAIIKTLSK